MLPSARSVNTPSQRKARGLAFTFGNDMKSRLIDASIGMSIFRNIGFGVVFHSDRGHMAPLGTLLSKCSLAFSVWTARSVAPVWNSRVGI
jgi:hypothetical protein